MLAHIAMSRPIVMHKQKPRDTSPPRGASPESCRKTWQAVMKATAKTPWPEWMCKAGVARTLTANQHNHPTWKEGPDSWKERLHAFNVCFAAHLKQQGIDSVIPQPFVDKVAEHLKPKKPPSAPMVRRSNCTSCGKLFFLDGWQADSKHCSGCRRSTVVDGAKMPTAFFHRKDGRFTSVVSESIGRRNGVV